MLYFSEVLIPVYIWVVAAIAIICILLYKLEQNNDASKRKGKYSPKETLQRKYAEGLISRSEYEEEVRKLK